MSTVDKKQECGCTGSGIGFDPVCVTHKIKEVRPVITKNIFLTFSERVLGRDCHFFFLPRLHLQHRVVEKWGIPPPAHDKSHSPLCQSWDLGGVR